jgi:hypothetical protein
LIFLNLAMLDRLCYAFTMTEKPKKKRPHDLNLLAKSIVDEATGEEQPTAEENGKNPHAVALGRLGGKKGGPARAEKLSKEQRQQIARKAATARWTKKTSSE